MLLLGVNLFSLSTDATVITVITGLLFKVRKSIDNTVLTNTGYNYYNNQAYSDCNNACLLA